MAVLTLQQPQEIAVDGVEADESNLIKLIQGSNVVGSPCTLEIVRSRGIGNQSGGHPRAFTDPFVCLLIMDRPATVNSLADIEQNLVSLDHLTDDNYGELRYSWRRSESGLHLIKHV
jgi:hypothetical protein